MKYLGSHVSFKAPKYFQGAIEEALSYGADACMIYTGPPQNSKRAPIEKLKIQEGIDTFTKAGWQPFQIVVHAPYIINLANSANPDTSYFGRDFLKEEIVRTAAIGSKYLVLHPGAHLKAGVEVGVEWICRAINEVLDEDDHDVMICLESMAGKGTEVGRNFSELKMIIDGVHHKERMGVCLDTCHLHDAGYDLEHFDEVMEEFDSIVGLDRLKVFHINDSKNERGAHKDRHENIGKGYIGFETLAKIVHDPRLDNVVKILETPYIEGNPPYKEEIAQLRSYSSNE
ncbi:deoxyribonuclease IV [Allobaculum stercoricanis]|uniref:deoxyribonuclease IV n=1 Tax=Allobaculum stercoricanis TaxID=174709 RepID=UPI00248ECAC9|nr:deoxyribonuclease IV [Allobaculum stercoricanis]